MIPARPTVRDGAPAVIGIVLVALGSWRAATWQQAPRPLDAWALLLIGVAAGVLAWRRSAPMPALTVSTVATSGYLLLGYAYGPILLCAGWAMFEVARRRPLRSSAVTGVIVALVSVAAVLPRLSGEVRLLVVALALWAGCWLALPWSLGAVVYVRTMAADQARRDLVERTALEERIRVSREVHDVAGHGFAVIAMQAAVALVVLDERPEQARASLEAIRATSTAALDELRGVLHLERPSEPVPGDGVRDLVPLVERARAAGLPVDLRLGDVEGVPAEVGEIIYKVVRESLTNVMRHTGRAGATVTVGHENGRLAAAIVDRGTGPAPGGAGQGLPPGSAGMSPAPGDAGMGLGPGDAGVGLAPGDAGISLPPGDAGLGLAGMRARVEAAGGGFTAGARDGGGFAVRVWFPSPGGAG
ncbi:sensor histidine kinase [Sphaerisporangium corydalis]|uniref:sensor histidine kinase n=1 Tax=Sphaerisporangium corydalis TaxID=1441875 RepID=UPI0036D23B46